MPYTSEHMVLQWGGSYRQGSPTGQALEIFTGSIRFAGPGLDASEGKATALALAIVMQRYWSNPAALIPKSAYLEYVKWNRVTTEGLYKRDTTTGVNIPPTLGGAQVDRYPTQVAWATTWGTDVVRGNACRGRTFWPTAAPFEANLKVSETTCLTKAGLDIDLIRDLNDAARTGGVTINQANPAPQWAIDLGFSPDTVRDGSGMSAVVMSKIGSGTTRSINRAEVGDRLDIQRRRANTMSDRRQSAV